MVEEEEDSKPSKRAEFQYVSGIVGMSNNPYLGTKAGAAYMNFEVTEMLKLKKKKVIEIDTTEREKPSLSLLLEHGIDIIYVPRSKKRLELRLGGG